MHKSSENGWTMGLGREKYILWIERELTNMRVYLLD